MNTSVKDPRSLTKERLKSELINHDISLPPSDSRKEVYVQMYRDHILTPATSSTCAEVDSNRARLEALSSDEEDTDDYPVHSKKMAMTNGDTDPITAEEVDSLTDDELYMALARRGETVGPIVDSTRRVYQKKLKRILTSETDATSEYVNGHHEEPMNEDEFSDQDDEEPMETDVIPPYKIPEPPQQQQRKQPTKVPSESYQTVSKETVSRTTVSKEARVAPSGDDKPVITHRSSTKVTTRSESEKKADDIVTQATEVNEKTLASINSQRQIHQKRQGISVWVQVSIIGVCALLVFLVLSNMEPAYTNPALDAAETNV